MDEASGILAGPRGRRLCLEAAREVGGDGVHQALFWLAHRHDANPGVWLLAPGQSAAEMDAFAAEAAQLPDLVAAIGGVDTGLIDGEVVERAFARSVDAARYWQEPDGEDVVAALPEVVDALRTIAAAVESLPETDWWSEALRTTQWAIEWDVADSTVAVNIGTLADLARSRAETVAGNERAARERPDDPEAPWSGQWWSTPGRVARTTGENSAGVPAGLALVEDGLGWKEATAIRMGGAGRIREIRSAQEWAALCREHPLEVTHEHRQDWFRVTGRDGTWVEPDWTAVAAEWDAVHLSAFAYLTGATRLIPVDEDRASVIAGWSPDATYWLTGRVRALRLDRASPVLAQEPLGERRGWRWDEEDAWVPLAD